ncbi:hypothetical protein GOD58_15050 [Sinorhizobium medicae]|nr:hypothetical protein [Sinorhizobium medicae]
MAPRTPAKLAAVLSLASPVGPPTWRGHFDAGVGLLGPVDLAGGVHFLAGDAEVGGGW